MPDLNFDNFKRYMDESHTEEGRKRQEEESLRTLVQHGRAYDLEVDDEEGDEEAVVATLPPPLKKAGQQKGTSRDDDTTPTKKPAQTVEDRWASIKKEYGTWGQT